MTKIFLETTVLTEALLKTRARRTRAINAIKQASESTLPTYSLKEFKAGPLDHFVWLHNKLLVTKSLRSTYEAIARNIRRPYRVTTSLEALAVGAESLTGHVSKETPQQADERHAAVYMLTIRRRILRGWAERKRITTTLFDPAECFSDRAPYFDEIARMMENPSKNCDAIPECSLAQELRKDPAKLAKLIQAMKNETRQEDNRRRAALHILKNTPKRKFTAKDCKDLGDAYFALRCPSDCKILTSNARDHLLLGAAVGVEVEKFTIKEEG